ncbi:MAG: TonB-dependent receptor [Chitinophagaceae bacterium]|nr:TonB-dependent receptor [Chitinophagaceae bacterium]
MRRLLFTSLVLILAGTSFSQVTTSSVSGTVLDKTDPLIGASVTLIHESTGSKFTTTSRAGGRFDIPNIPPGGPYTIKVTYVGFSEYQKQDINIPLGEKFEIKVELTSSVQELQNVVISGRKAATEKTGASSSFSRRVLASLPNVSRNITAATRLVPQSNGNSIAGMNYRYNNLTIDGSLFNNNFGRSGDGQIPGGATSAISFDAIDQIQVNIAPYDVRQAGFVGGGINAVTRRGTNNWYGTVYGFFRNQGLNGSKVAGVDVDNSKRSTKIWGASIGGPIVKNKLFFFVNVEGEKRTSPGQIWLAKRPGQNDDSPLVTPVLASDLDNLKSYLISQYNYDPGAYEGYDFKTDNLKILARVDWNINSRHRLTLRYTQSETNDDDQINATSITGINANRINNGRRAGTSGGMAYYGSNFKNNTKVFSGVVELNSSFNSTVSNQLLASYTDNSPVRIPNSNMPFVDIMRDANNVYISFGTDLFSYKNSINDKAYNIADNITLNLGKHTVTAGASFEYLKFANSFASAGGPSYYRYNSLEDFMNNTAPAVFAVTYDPSDRTNIKAAEAEFAQLGLYIQDVWSTSDKFKLTYGIRFDKPFYPYKAPRNQALEEVVFRDEEGNPESFDVSKWPKSRVLVSPRIGFTYDPEGDKSTIIRGGSGVFTGRIPFIWLVNQVGDNGVIRALYQATGTDLAAIRYNADRTAYIPQNPPAVGQTIPSGSSFSAAAKDFKMPQVWRTNIAVDRKIGQNLVLTLEAIHTKMINNVYFRNANLGDQNGTVGGKLTQKPYFNSRLNSGVNQMIVMDNTNKGSSLSITPMIQKTYANGWNASLAYTYTYAEDVAIGTSDQSGSSWTTNNIAFNPNRPELGYSNFSVPHRIVGNISYRIEYLNRKMATTFGLVYAAASQDRYTFRYGADINGDGQSNDIIYIPKDPSEIQFVEGFKVGSNTYTAQQQSDAFFRFIENNPYLSKNKGRYMDRYGAVLPWVHTVDLRILQDFIIRTGEKKHTIQVSADVLNLLNLLNNSWGYRYSYTFGTFQDMGLLGTPTSSNNAGNEGFNRNNPKFTFDPNGPTKAFQPNYSTASTWGIQLGLRYIFD